MNPVILVVEIPIVPKARPRVTRGRAYMPEAYNRNQVMMSRIFAEARGRCTVPVPCDVVVLLGRAQSRRGDLDNIAGAVLDALVKSRLIPGDGQKYISGINIRRLDVATVSWVILTDHEPYRGER